LANARHLERLKEGVEAWNAWRSKEPNALPDLEDANLRDTDLSGYDLSRSSLRGADLRRSTLGVRWVEYFDDLSYDPKGAVNVCIRELESKGFSFAVVDPDPRQSYGFSGALPNGFGVRSNSRRLAASLRNANVNQARLSMRFLWMLILAGRRWLRQALAGRLSTLTSVTR
jgi:uncharacterized protein YjbI with pentapeptide repeats